MGNSEVGHLNIGAGRVVMQELPRISQAAKDGSLARAPALTDLIAKLKASGGTCHLLGLMSPGGVHSHQEHAVALAKILHEAGVKTVVHAFTDGRDTPPRSAADDMQWLREALPRDVPIATVIGRYYAMDRDKRWDRVAKAYAALAEGEGARFDDPVKAVQDGYAHDVTDEFIVPAVIGDYKGMQDGDGILCFNFRADRVREILGALLEPTFDGFPRKRVDPIRRRRRHDALFGRTGAVSRRAVPAGDAGSHPGPGGGRGRARAAAHRGDREVSARHLFPQRRPGDDIPGRGPHHGALAEGRDLRPAAGDVRPGTHRQGGGGDRLEASTT